jgi:hypothetical protein
MGPRYPTDASPMHPHRRLLCVPRMRGERGTAEGGAPMENTFELDVEQTDFDVLENKEY